MEYIVYDLETTGLDWKTDAIIQIAAIHRKDHKTIAKFDSYIKQDYALPNEIIALTGITDAVLQTGMAQAECIKVFYDFCSTLPMIAHNGSRFDALFLKREAAACGRVFTNPQIDSLLIARECIPGLKSYRLEALAEELGCEVKKSHNAINDVQMLVDVVEALPIKEKYI